MGKDENISQRQKEKKNKKKKEKDKRSGCSHVSAIIRVSWQLYGIIETKIE